MRPSGSGFAADSSKFFVYDTEALHVFPTDGGDGVRRPVELDWAVSPDLEQLASVEYTDQRPFVVIRRISNDEELQRFASDRRPDAYFAGLSLSDAGLLAAAMHEDAIPNDTIEFWDLEKAIAYPTEVELEGEVMQLTFAPGGDWLVAVTHDAERVPQTHVLRLAASQDDVEVLEQRVDAYDASSNGAQPAAISADARRISSTVLRDDGMCCFTVRDLTTGALIAEFEPAPDAPTIYTALSPDGRQLAGTVYRVREE